MWLLIRKCSVVWIFIGCVADLEDLNKKFPGHKEPLRVIQDKVAECTTCQVARLGMEHNIITIWIWNHPLPWPYRHWYSNHNADNDGKHLLPCRCRTILNKFAGIYPAKGHTAIETTLACFLHFTRYHKVEEIYSDPGSDLTSETVRYLNLWLGQKHVFL
jgi:hypothetical protein